MESPKIRVNKSPWSSDIELLISQGNAIVKDVTFEPVDVAAINSPSLVISNTKAQQLMDDLWTAGLRPSEGTGSAGSLAATERHLQDMRTLVFNSNK